MKVRRLLLTSSACFLLLLYLFNSTCSQERDFCFSLFSFPWPAATCPPFNLIPRLSNHTHKKRIVLRRCPLNSSCRPRLPVPLFQLHTALQVSSSSHLPSRSNCRKLPGIALVRRSSRLPLVDFLLDPSASQTLFRDFFVTYLTCLTRQVTLFSIKKTTHGFSILSIADFGFSLDFLYVVSFLFALAEQETKSLSHSLLLLFLM